jgi:hypothetical protein
MGHGVGGGAKQQKNVAKKSTKPASKSKAKTKTLCIIVQHTTYLDMASSEWVYLLIEREFLKTKEAIYKIGRTDDWDARVKQYPKGSALLGLVHVNDSILAEKALIATFKQQFAARRDVGREYFEGEHQAILTSFFFTATKFVASQCPSFAIPPSRLNLQCLRDDADDDGDNVGEDVQTDAVTTGVADDNGVEDGDRDGEGITNDFDLNLWHFVTNSRVTLEQGPVLLQTFYDDFLKWFSMQPRKDAPRKKQGRGSLFQARTSVKTQFGVAAESSKDGIVLRFDLQNGMVSTNPVEDWFKHSYELTGQQSDTLPINNVFTAFVKAHHHHRDMSKKLFGILMKRIDLTSKVVGGTPSSYRAYIGVRLKNAPPEPNIATGRLHIVKKAPYCQRLWPAPHENYASICNFWTRLHMHVYLAPCYAMHGCMRLCTCT